MRFRMLVAAVIAVASLSGSVASAATTSGPLKGVDNTAKQGLAQTFTVGTISSGYQVTSATINWGDGLGGVGTASAQTITGKHTYPNLGTYNVTVAANIRQCLNTVIGPICLGQATTTYFVTETITVSDPIVTTDGSASGVVIDADAGVPFTGTVATGTTGASTASINWGDGATGPGTPAGNDVTGVHTWAQAGSYNVMVTATRPDVDAFPGGCAYDRSVYEYGALLSAAFGVVVPPYTPNPGACIAGRVYHVVSHVTVHSFGLSVVATGVTSTEGIPVSGRVAGLPDACDGCTYAARIGWGDGSTSTGTVVASGSGKAVTGSHNYGDQPGTYKTTVTVTAKSPRGHSMTASDTGTATIEDAALVASTGTEVVFDVGGAATQVTIGHLSDSGPNPKASDYTIGIDWGDGRTSTGSVTVDPLGGFSVQGVHSYASPATRTIRFHVHSAHGSNADGTATAIVDNPPLN